MRVAGVVTGSTLAPWAEVDCPSNVLVLGRVFLGTVPWELWLRWMLDGQVEIRVRRP